MLSSPEETYMLPAALYLAAGPEAFGFVLAKVVTADIKASGVYAELFAEKLLVTPQRVVPESYPNSSPTSWVACCTTIPPSPVAFDPEANNTNLSATSKFEVCWKEMMSELDELKTQRNWHSALLFEHYYFNDDMTLQKLSDEIGISLSTTYMHTKRIKEHLKSKLDNPFKPKKD